MKIIFTKNNYPLSFIIRAVTGEKASHVAIVFDDIFLVQINLFGVSMQYFDKFKKHQKIVHEISIPLSLEKEDEIWRAMITMAGLYSYDIPFLIYSAFSVIVKRIFNKEIKKKILDSNNKSLCYDLLILLQNHFDFKFGIDEDKKHLLTPGVLHKKLTEGGY